MPVRDMGAGIALYYSGLVVDRAGSRRADAAWRDELLAKPDTRVIPLWRDHCLVRERTPLQLIGGAARDVVAQVTEPVLLGLVDGTAVFAADLSDLDRADALALATVDDMVDVRSLVPVVDRQLAGLLAYARGILHWNRNQRFCGACGGRAVSSNGGHLRICQRCGKELFPRIEPAVIVLVELPGRQRRCLLGRHRGAAANRFSLVAGFVEIGESLEDAVRREVVEEAGVSVGAVTYQASQAWPFPAGLMVGFRAEASSEEIRVDGAELVEARWFTAAELAARIADPAIGGPYRTDSIDRVLIQRWLADAAT